MFGGNYLNGNKSGLKILQILSKFTFLFALFKTTNKYLILSPHSQHFQKLILSTTFCKKFLKKHFVFYKPLCRDVACSSCRCVCVGACYIREVLSVGGSCLDNWLLLTTGLTGGCFN